MVCYLILASVVFEHTVKTLKYIFLQFLVHISIYKKYTDFLLPQNGHNI